MSLFIDSLEPRRLMSDSAPLGNGTLYVDTDAEFGTEVWFYNADGVAQRVTDINAGPAGSNPRNLQRIDHYVYFIATDASGVTSLYWRGGDAAEYGSIAFDGQGITTRPESGVLSSGRWLIGVHGNLWSSSGTPESMRWLGKSPSNVRGIIFNGTMWYLPNNLGGNVYSTNGMALSRGQQLGVSSSGYYQWTMGMPYIKNGLLIARYSYMWRTPTGPQYASTYWYTGGGSWSNSDTEPTSAPTPPPSNPPSPPSNPPDPFNLQDGVPARVNGTIMLRGTAGNDRIRIRTSGTDIAVDVNGVTYRFATEFLSGVQQFDGQDGADIITVDESAGAIALPFRIFGGLGRDQIRTGSKDDTIYGGHGDDTLEGGAGSDRIYGDAGNDIIDGGLGTDRLFGGSGSDIFASHKRIELMDANRLDQLL